MRIIIVVSISLYFFTHGFSQSWPHPLIFKGETLPEYQYVLQNTDFSDHEYIASFRNFSKKLDFGYEDHEVTLWSAVISAKDEIIYNLMRMDVESGAVIYNQSILTDDQVNIVNHIVEGNRLILYGFTHLGNNFGPLDLYVMEYDLDTGEELSYSRIFKTDIIGFNSSYKAVQSNGKYFIYPNKRFFYAPHMVFSELNGEGIVSSDTLLLSNNGRNLITDVTKDGNKYDFFNFGSDYLANDMYADSLFTNATYSYIQLDEDFQELDRVEIYDLFPYGWEIDLMKETEDYYLFYCAEGHDTDEGKSSAMVLMDKQFNVVKIVDASDVEGIVYDVDQSGKVYCMVRNESPLYYIYNFSLMELTEQGAEEVLSFRVDDMRKVVIEKIAVYDDYLFMQSFADKADDMNIMTKISLTK